MKQVLIRHGRISVESVPAPLVEPGAALVEVAYSLISAGTETASVSAAAKPLAQRALEQPQRVLQLIDLLRQQGITRTVEQVRSQIDAGYPIGYSCAGTVIQVGKGVRGLRPGTLVACAGAGQANHAEMALVPENLVVPVPAGCDLKSAASVAVGAIALQGIRRADPRLGDIVAVIGLGLLGLLSVQMLKAGGARVVGIDLDPRRVELARQMGAEIVVQAGAEDAVKAVNQFSGGQGADATIITAAGKSNEIVQQAMQMTRRKGRVVVVGDVGLGLERAEFYRKEIDFLISTSYGPGRYDPAYEDRGVDYPYAYVRWTEGRNMAEYLRQIAAGDLDFTALIDREYPVEQAAQAFSELNEANPRPIGVLLAYEEKRAGKRATRMEMRPAQGGRIGLGLIGAGAFALSTQLPIIKELGGRYRLQGIASATGGKAKDAATQYGAAYATTDYREMLADPAIDAVLISTRHHLHARQTIEAARAGKAVFLEKPLAMNPAELDEVIQVIEESGVPFMVGYNRRFSPYATEARRHSSQRRNPLFMRYRMNAGRIPFEHWVHGPEGGGRIIGEACHVIDLLTSFTGARVKSVSTARLSPQTDYFSGADNVLISLEYEDGSIAALEYLTVGAGSLPKEWMEIHFDEKSILIDNYQSISGYGLRVNPIRTAGPQKGHKEELIAFAEYLEHPERGAPIALWDLEQTARITFAIEGLGEA